MLSKNNGKGRNNAEFIRKKRAAMLNMNSTSHDTVYTIFNPKYIIADDDLMQIWDWNKNLYDKKYPNKGVNTSASIFSWEDCLGERWESTVVEAKNMHIAKKDTYNTLEFQTQFEQLVRECVDDIATFDTIVDSDIQFDSIKISFKLELRSAAIFMYKFLRTCNIHNIYQKDNELYIEIVFPLSSLSSSLFLYYLGKYLIVGSDTKSLIINIDKNDKKKLTDFLEFYSLKKLINLVQAHLEICSTWRTPIYSSGLSNWAILYISDVNANDDNIIKSDSVVSSNENGLSELKNRFIQQPESLTLNLHNYSKNEVVDFIEFAVDKYKNYKKYGEVYAIYLQSIRKKPIEILMQNLCELSHEEIEEIVDSIYKLKRNDLLPELMLNKTHDIIRQYIRLFEREIAKYSIGISRLKNQHECLLCLYIKLMYPTAIWQYRQGFLEGLSIDIYIPELKTGIEYQGAQHYNSIDYFGGESGFSDQKARDEKKRKLCKKNGIRLIEWEYTSDINLANVIKFLESNGIANSYKIKYDFSKLTINDLFQDVFGVQLNETSQGILDKV